MSSMHHMQEALEIDASPETLYAIVADYRVGHPAILPPGAFGPLIVEQGGVGAGTITRGSIKIWGKNYPFRHSISEPEPGRVLKETDLDTGQYTIFTFDSLDSGRRTRVTFDTWFPQAAGLAGWLDVRIKTMIAHKLYKEELRRLADYAARPQSIGRDDSRQPEQISE